MEQLNEYMQKNNIPEYYREILDIVNRGELPGITLDIVLKRIHETEAISK